MSNNDYFFITDLYAVQEKVAGDNYKALLSEQWSYITKLGGDAEAVRPIRKTIASILLGMSLAEKVEDVYRIEIFKTRVEVRTFDTLENVDILLSPVYDSVNDLPEWVRERIAILSMLPLEYPTEPVKGVGRRISSEVFWVNAPDKV